MSAVNIGIIFLSFRPFVAVAFISNLQTRCGIILLLVRTGGRRCDTRTAAHPSTFLQPASTCRTKAHESSTAVQEGAVSNNTCSRRCRIRRALYITLASAYWRREPVRAPPLTPSHLPVKNDHLTTCKKSLKCRYLGGSHRSKEGGVQEFPSCPPPFPLSSTAYFAASCSGA